MTDAQKTAILTNYGFRFTNEEVDKPGRWQAYLPPNWIGEWESRHEMLNDIGEWHGLPRTEEKVNA